MYPSASELRKLERETLRRVTEIGEFGKLGDLQSAANRAISSINELTGTVDVNLGFILDIRLRGDRKGKPVPRRIDLGALVVATADNKHVRNASYSLLICRNSQPKTSPVVRKIHFDYEPEAFRNLAEPKPSFHMQLCGKLSPHHRNEGYSEIKLQALYPGWEKPRIPIAPTCIALMLNWLLLEFQADPASQAILRNPSWRKWVAHAERMILLPYFAAAKKFLDSTAHKDRRFLQAHLYGMESE